MRMFLNWCGRSLLARPQRDVIGHGELRLLILHTVLSEGPLCGAEIEARLEGRLCRAGLDAAPIDSVVDMLDRLDYLRPYAHAQVLGITEDGIALLDGNKHALTDLLGRLDADPADAAGPEGSLLLALEGLSATLRLSLLGGRLDGRQAREVRRAIEALTDRLEHA